ncbi:uncharacterized protein MONOS_16942 [Monocercomonoides exilis]|uniref:uncharacterized protein n=1 Tax=Monocercomonoides exilis TaxID=2049356 RepID=UPI00355A9442|nr:hypothetical protein MONOS_16942 [Monocercomonoides exilis]
MLHWKLRILRISIQLLSTVPLLITEINLSGKTEEERKRIEIALVALGQISIVNNSAFFEATQLKDQLFNLITLQKKRPYLTDM